MMSKEQRDAISDRMMGNRYGGMWDHKRHGEAPRPGKRPTKEYLCWTNMKTRCSNPRAVGYHNYGGRGITVCQRWRDSYEAFLADMGRAPTPAHTIERVENSGSYEPGNCRWATWSEQARNRRPRWTVKQRPTKEASK